MQCSATHVWCTDVRITWQPLHAALHYVGWIKHLLTHFVEAAAAMHLSNCLKVALWGPKKSQWHSAGTVVLTVCTYTRMSETVGCYVTHWLMLAQGHEQHKVFSTAAVSAKRHSACGFDATWCSDSDPLLKAVNKISTSTFHISLPSSVKFWTADLHDRLRNNCEFCANLCSARHTVRLPKCASVQMYICTANITACFERYSQQSMSTWRYRAFWSWCKPAQRRS